MTSGADIKKHIIEHEILGVSAGGGGSISWVKRVSGQIYVYDNTRTKWLSSDRMTIAAGRAGRANNVYLRIADTLASNVTGYRMPRNATILSIAAQTRGTETWTVRLRKNGSDTNIASLAISAAEGNHDTSLNVNLDEGDTLHIYADTPALLGIRDVAVWVEIAWRE